MTADQAAAASQAWRSAWARGCAALALPVLLIGCTERIGELDPRPGISNLFFATHLEGRQPPPGLDQPWPHLSSVPERPAPPDPATRERLSAGLAADRERSRTPLAAGSAAGGSAAGPPPPARLAAVPVIPVEAPPTARPAALPAPSVTTPSASPAPAPAVSQPPPAEGPAPPPAPPIDLIAPPPPPSRDLLAPRGG
jgi:hypothetical protein